MTKTAELKTTSRELQTKRVKAAERAHDRNLATLGGLVYRAHEEGLFQTYHDDRLTPLLEEAAKEFWGDPSLDDILNALGDTSGALLRARFDRDGRA
jgi:hypothetical protein